MFRINNKPLICLSVLLATTTVANSNYISCIHHIHTNAEMSGPLSVCVCFVVVLIVDA